MMVITRKDRKNALVFGGAKVQLIFNMSKNAIVNLT